MGRRGDPKIYNGRGDCMKGGGDCNFPPTPDTLKPLPHLQVHIHSGNIMCSYFPSQNSCLYIKNMWCGHELKMLNKNM